MFGVVPKTIWQKTNPADERNRIKLALRSLLLKSNDRVIIIDCGITKKFKEKERDMYGIEDYPIEKSLAKINLSVTDITDVILTHLHFDHGGGISDESGKNLTFPNAIYHINKKQWEHAQNPSLRDRASFVKGDYELLQNSQNFNLLNDESKIAKGVNIIPTNGHTPGHQIVTVEDSNTKLLYLGDLIPTTTHVKVPYIMGYDLYPMDTLKEKEIILERAEREKWILFFEHDPVTSCANVMKSDRGYACLNLSLKELAT